MSRVLASATTLLAVMSWAAPVLAQPLRVQLSWQHQAQFAGYYVADARRFYQREGLEVSITPGGPGIAPLERLQRGEADIAVAWLPHALDARVRGADIVNIAQVFQRPAMALACRKSESFRSARDVAGRSIGVWNLGDEASVRLWLRRQGIAEATVKLLPQAAHAADLIAGRVACATVMTYNELWDVPHAGLSRSDFLVVRFGEEGLGLLEDGLYVRRATLADATFRQQLVAFLRASAAGWREARLDPDEAIETILARAPGIERHHQERMLETVLTLMPAASPFGLLMLDEYQRTVQILADGGLGLRGLPGAAREAWTHRIWEAADLAPATTLPPTTQYYLSTAVRTRWFYVLDLVGTAAFGLAGFMRAQQRRYDLWGTFVLTSLPAVGGGTLRDLIVGGTRHPPFIFRDSTYLVVVLAVVVVGTVVTRLTPASIMDTRGFARTLTVFDTLGLSVFAVIGAQVALVSGLGWYWVAICAALTAAGGGILLDVVTGREPRTFQGEPYEEVAIGGALLFYLLLRAAAPYEYTPWLVSGTIVVTLVATCAARIAIIKFGIRSYRLAGRKA